MRVVSYGSRERRTVWKQIKPPGMFTTLFKARHNSHFGMSEESDTDSLDGVFDGVVRAQHGLKIVFEDAFETIVVGEVYDLRKSKVLNKRKKKSTKTYKIPEASLATSRSVVRYLNEGVVDPDVLDSIVKIRDMFMAAKAMGINDLIDVCVDAAVDILAKEGIDLLRGGAANDETKETECLWVYDDLLRR